MTATDSVDLHAHEFHSAYRWHPETNSFDDDPTFCAFSAKYAERREHAAAALRATLTAPGSRARARRLDVACSHSDRHRLAEVFWTGDGLVVVAYTRVPVVIAVTDGGVYESGRRREPWVDCLAAPSSVFGARDAVMAGCACGWTLFPVADLDRRARGLSRPLILPKRGKSPKD